jgi:hypothetical protein
MVVDECFANMNGLYNIGQCQQNNKGALFIEILGAWARFSWKKEDFTKKIVGNMVEHSDAMWSNGGLPWYIQVNGLIIATSFR